MPAVLLPRTTAAGAGTAAERARVRQPTARPLRCAAARVAGRRRLAVLVLMVPSDQLDSGAPFAAAFETAGMTWGRYIVALGALFGIVPSTLVRPGRAAQHPGRRVQRPRMPVRQHGVNARTRALADTQRPLRRLLAAGCRRCQVGMYATARIIAAVARQHLLPPLFAKVHARTATPWIATICQGLAVSLITLFTGAAGRTRHGRSA